MAWDLVTAPLLSKALDIGLESAASAIQMFDERRTRGWRPPFGERFLNLSGADLLSAYRSDTPVVAQFAGESFILPASVECAASHDGRLDKQRLGFQMEDQDFTLNESLVDYVSPLRKMVGSDRRLFDGKVTRLSGFDSEGVATLQPASYYEALATNFAMDHRPNGRSESLREFLHGRKHSVGPMVDSKLVNHLGVVCMLEAADGQLIAQKRSTQVANRPGSVSASVSGAVNLSDLHALTANPITLSVFARCVFRETLEELGVRPHDIRFLGLFREFLRGGKPELYFFARSHKASGRIRDRTESSEGRSEFRSISTYDYHSERVSYDENSRFAFQQRVKNILTSVGDSANLTFVAGVLLASKHVLHRAS